MNKVRYPDELALLDKYLCGDQVAGEELFGAAYPTVKKFVFAATKSDIVLSKNDKEDIISEAMIRAIDHQHLYNGSSKFQTFIIGYAKNIILEQHRKRTKEVTKTVSLDDEFTFEAIDPFDNPLKVIIKMEQLEAIQQAINLLPEEQRTVLILRILNDMPFKQLALLVGKSDDAVDSLFRRSIKGFKNNFEKIYNGATDF
ncbi:MAG: sigma-70 family RNA polymerase sigma factor [Syntrophomonas sp.]